MEVIKKACTCMTVRTRLSCIPKQSVAQGLYNPCNWSSTQYHFITETLQQMGRQQCKFWFFAFIAKVLQGRCNLIARVLQSYSKGAAVLLQRCCKGGTVLLQGCCNLQNFCSLFEKRCYNKDFQMLIPMVLNSSIARVSKLSTSLTSCETYWSVEKGCGYPTCGMR